MHLCNSQGRVSLICLSILRSTTAKDELSFRLTGPCVCLCRADAGALVLKFRDSPEFHEIRIMTTLREQIAIDLAGLVDEGELSEEISYTPKGGDAKTINALVGPLDTEIEDDELGETKVKRRRIVILTDAARGIAAPKINDLITLGTDIWRVSAIEAEGFGKATLSIVLGETESKHHEQYKRKIE